MIKCLWIKEELARSCSCLELIDHDNVRACCRSRSDPSSIAMSNPPTKDYATPNNRTLIAKTSHTAKQHGVSKMNESIIFDPKAHSHLIHQFVKMHQQCITTPPHTIATFLPPLDSTIMRTWWGERVQEAVDGGRIIIMQLARNEETGGEELAGYVMLGKPVSQTLPFRGIVEKLLVSPEHRRKGIARRLMERLEDVAREAGRTLLVS
jgi:GNAT superfamily N-acetyltransferase